MMNELTFKKVASLWLDSKRYTVKANTFQYSYADIVRLHLLPYFSECRIDEITKKSFKEHLLSLADKYSDSTLKKIKLCMANIYEFAADEGCAVVNPANGVNVKSTVEKRARIPYSHIQKELLYDYASTHKYGLGICIMIETGLRCSELLGLKWGDIDFNNCFLTVSRASVSIEHRPYVSSPKSETSKRTIPMTKRLVDLLRTRYNGEDDFIFLTTKGKPFCPASYTKQRYDLFFKDATVALGLQRLSPHMLRHTCGTLLYAKSGDIYAVSKYLGHSNVNVTAKYYVHSSPYLLKQRLAIE